MKSFHLVRLWFVSLLFGTGVTLAQDANLHWTSPVKQRCITFYAEPQGKPPEEMSYMIGPANPDPKFQADWENAAQTNHHLLPLNWDEGANIFDEYKQAVWVPFQTNVLVDLGPGDGERWLWVGFRMFGDEKPHRVGYGIYTNIKGGNWNAHDIMLQTLPPTVVITAPKPGITFQPRIELQGYASVPIVKLRYGVLDQDGKFTGRGGEGGITDQYFDPVLGRFTTNCFECLDLDLRPGTNVIQFQCEDGAGNQWNTNLVYVFTTVGATNPPVFSVTWPKDGAALSGSQFDLYGRCDMDPTAAITGLLTDDNGQSSHLEGFVERNGCLWMEHVPVAAGKSYLTIVATDAANNSSVTNLMFMKSSTTLYMDKVADPNQLWQPRITITGYCSDTNRTVTVSGVRATLKPDGHWVAQNVPVNSPNGGGTAISAGLSFPVVGTNEYNHYPVIIGLTNASGHNLPGSWMLPGANARFAVHLYDSNHLEVAKQERMGGSGQTLATDLNIHHLGKDELNKLDGIISFLTNATVWVASFNLDQYFKPLPPGDYRLEIGVRMFEILADGRLLPFEFPALVTPVKIIDQPSEMVFSLEQRGKLTWGAERYGLRAGLVHDIKWPQMQDANRIEVYVQNRSTNDYRWSLRFPNPDEEFDVTLYDASGKEVPKTALGKRQGQPLSLDGQSPRPPGGMFNTFIVPGSHRSPPIPRVFVSSKDPTECGKFNLNDYFEIKTPGEYRLTFQERLYLLNTNGILTGMILPLVNVPLDINYVPGQ